MFTLSLHLPACVSVTPISLEMGRLSLTAAGEGIENKGQGHEKIRLSFKKGTARCLQTKALYL